MEKINKTKIVIMIIVALVVIAAIILGVIFLGKNKEEKVENEGASISKTESEFEPLSIKDIELKYIEESNETKLEFLIHNSTDEKIENQKMKIHLLDENESLISGLDVDVATIDPKGDYKVDITLGGNIQNIKKIKLVKPEEAPEDNPEE